MKTLSQRVAPDEFILSVLSPEERLDAAFEIAETAFKKNSLTFQNIESAVGKIRKKIYGEKKSSY